MTSMTKHPILTDMLKGFLIIFLTFLIIIPVIIRYNNSRPDEVEAVVSDMYFSIVIHIVN